MSNTEISNILDNLLLSGEFPTKDKEILQSNNVTAILNCSSELLNHFENDFSYFNIKVEDDDRVKIHKYFDICHDFINKHEKVLIHCQAGVSRSPTIVISYLMKHKNYSMKDAFDLVKNKRNIIFPNVGFIHQLMEYEKLINNTSISSFDFLEYLTAYFYELFDDKMKREEFKVHLEKILEKNENLSDVIDDIYNL
jgi:protein-tyrosine phosphatase